MKRTFVPALVFSTMVGILLPPIPANAQMTGAQMTGAQMTRAQMLCGKRTDIVRQLDEKYGETRRSMGLAGGRGVVELYASDETGSWTILLTTPQGNACMMASGEAFQIEPVKVVGNPV
jgi:hypothetical protein